MACIITYENKQYTQKEFEQYFKEHFTEFVDNFLGSKKDIEGFKNYVQNKKQNEDFSVESETIQNNTQDLSQELNNTTDLNLTCFL